MPMLTKLVDELRSASSSEPTVAADDVYPLSLFQHQRRSDSAGKSVPRAVASGFQPKIYSGDPLATARGTDSPAEFPLPRTMRNRNHWRITKSSVFWLPLLDSGIGDHFSVEAEVFEREGPEVERGAGRMRRSRRFYTL
jgi:hypothetical protein